MLPHGPAFGLEEVPVSEVLDWECAERVNCIGARNAARSKVGFSNFTEPTGEVQKLPLAKGKQTQITEDTGKHSGRKFATACRKHAVR